MAIKTLRVFAEYTSTGFVPMPTLGNIDYGYTLANTFPSTTPSSFQTDDPDLDVTVTAMTDFYVWIRINGTAWNPSYTRNVRVYPDSPDINSVVMNMIIATGPAGVSSYTQIVQTANRLYFNGATADSVYNSKFAGKTYINELNFGTAPQLATVATTGAYADLTGKPALSTVATSGSYADLSNKPSGTAPISYNSGTNSFQITQANTSTNGFLSSTDWNTFNAKYLLPSGGTTAQYLRGDGTIATFPTTLDSTRLIFTGRNNTGTTLTKGTVVYINGVSGNTALLARAIATGDSTSAQTLGIVEFDIANNSNGVVVLVGAVNNLDTSSFTEGVQLYLSGTTAGTYTSVKNLAPTHLVYVGIVTRAHPTQGTIEVKVQNGYELDEIHDVQISNPANKDILYHDTTTSLWKHASVASVLGYTPYNASNPSAYIALSALSASAPLSYNNTTGAFTISQANTTTNGFLSSTDWNTFNSKQSALTLGNVTEVSSNVLMFPDGGTGKTIGNLSIQVIQASASTNGYLSSTDWTTFNNKQNAITGGATTITTSNLTVSRALVSNASGKVDVSTVTSTELGYLSGVTSAIQTQLNAKQNTITNPVSGTSTSGYVTFWNGTSAVSGDSNLFWDNTNKRLGIGTSLPNQLVTLSASAYPILGFNIGSTTQGYIGSLNGGGIAINSQIAQPLMFFTNDTERMRITSAGNVGVGITSPVGFESSDLVTQIYNVSTGSSRAMLRLTNSYSGSTWGNGSWFSIDSTLDMYLANSEAASIIFQTSATERMRITSAGNVGIGTSSPATNLHVLGTSNAPVIFASTSSTSFYTTYRYNTSTDVGYIGNGAGVASGGAVTDFGFQSAGNMLFASGGGTERMRITSGGNVGIGTGSPALSTGVAGLVVSNSSYVQLRVQSASTSAGIEFKPSTGNAWEVQAGNDNSWFVYDRTTEAFRLKITSNGNTLLGTTSDNGERLYVSGSIRATGNITANSDLVLKKNLTLVDNPIDKINKLNGYLYQWKENDEYQYGVIAQEIEKILPYAVSTGKDGIKGVSYNQLIPVLIEAVKEQNKKIIALEAKLG